jgi:hypothetical protein
MLPPEEIRAVYSTIRRNYGIELTWSEKVALSHYITSFQSYGKMQKEKFGKQGFILEPESIVHFMRDYFGLDQDELYNRVVRITKRGREIHSTFGIDVLGTDEFKKYCRSRVEFWRDQRTFP